MIIKAACIQMNGGPDVQDNLERSAVLIRSAVEQGATLIATPEITDQVISNRAEKIDQAYGPDNHPGVSFYSGLAKELAVTLLIGSMCVKLEGGKIANRSFLFGPDGALKVTYDKIHLYDVDLPTGESHRESRLFEPGNAAVAADMGDYKLGLSICYDLRFAHLYRDLAKAGAQILVVPAAFTVPTGKAHWEVLLRARAIETGSFVLAPAQSGDHHGARKTYGHSLIVGPWGEVLADAGTEEGVVMAELDLQEVEKARSSIPALKHDRDFKSAH